ncbi:MAG: hypothetical protein ACLR0U_14790 [Enterocloster clostridioformis]
MSDIKLTELTGSCGGWRRQDRAMIPSRRFCAVYQPSRRPASGWMPDHLRRCGVYQHTPELALIQTVDIFPQRGRCLWEYGQIAAADSCPTSMGHWAGKPELSHMNILVVPEHLPLIRCRPIHIRGGSATKAARG